MRTGSRVLATVCGATVLLMARPCVLANQPKPDGGKFTLLLHGKSIGTDTFRLLPDGCDSDVVLSTGSGPAVRFHQTLKYRKGQWTQVVTDAGPQGTMTVALAGPKSTLTVDGKAPTVQQLPRVVYPFGNSSPHLFAFLISAYDAKKGGEQRFDLLFSEGLSPAKGLLVVPATVNAPQTVVRRVGGKPLQVANYIVALTSHNGPLTMKVTTDKEKHILRWSVPAQNYTAVRDGYKDVAN